jgi:hypothetical protein
VIRRVLDLDDVLPKQQTGVVNMYALATAYMKQRRAFRVGTRLRLHLETDRGSRELE